MGWFSGIFKSVSKAVNSVFKVAAPVVSSLFGGGGGGGNQTTNVTYQQAPQQQQQLWTTSPEYKAQQTSIDNLRTQLSDYKTSSAAALQNERNTWSQQLQSQNAAAMQREQLAAQASQSRYDSYDQQIAAFNAANQARDARAQVASNYGQTGKTSKSVRANTSGAEGYNKRWFRRPSMSIGGGTGASTITDQSTNV